MRVGPRNPGVLAYILYLLGIAISTSSYAVIVLLSNALPGQVSMRTIGGFTSLVSLVGLLVTISGILVMRQTTWVRRGIGAGILVLGAIVSPALQYFQQWIMQEIMRSGHGVSLFHLMGFVAVGFAMITSVFWISSWLVARHASAIAWLVAVPIAMLTAGALAMIMRYGFAESFGPTLIVAHLVRIVMHVLLFGAAIFFAELITRSREHQTS